MRTFEADMRPNTGGQKTQDWKTRDGQKCTAEKRGTGKGCTKLHNWKTQEKACMESQCAELRGED